MLGLGIRQMYWIRLGCLGVFFIALDIWLAIIAGDNREEQGLNDVSLNTFDFFEEKLVLYCSDDLLVKYPERVTGGCS